MSSTMIHNEEQTAAANGEWEQFRTQLLEDPEARAAYERTFREVVALREILQACEAKREEAGLSKTELAQRVGMNPSAIRRLLTSETSNPTLKTMIGICDVLGLEITVRPTRRKKTLVVKQKTTRQRAQVA